MLPYISPALYFLAYTHTHTHTHTHTYIYIYIYIYIYGSWGSSVSIVVDLRLEDRAIGVRTLAEERLFPLAPFPD
jgi:hypothetical protein